MSIELVSAVAGELATGGEWWTAKARGAGIELARRSDGLALFCREDYRTHRIEVSLSLSPELHTAAITNGGRKYPKSITVAPGRPAAEIAREVQRRLIPGAEEVYRYARERLEKQESAKRRVAYFTEKYAKIVGADAQREGSVRLPYTETVHGDFRADEDGSIRLEVSIDAPLAEAVLRLIAGRQRAEAEEEAKQADELAEEHARSITPRQIEGGS